MMNIQEFTGYNFKVSILYRYSPLAWSIAHCNPPPLQYSQAQRTGVFLSSLPGISAHPSRSSSFQENCGGLLQVQSNQKKMFTSGNGGTARSSANNQSSFLYLHARCSWTVHLLLPRITRNKAKEYKVYILAMICLGSGTLILQMIESVDTGGILYRNMAK